MARRRGAAILVVAAAALRFGPLLFTTWGAARTRDLRSRVKAHGNDKELLTGEGRSGIEELWPEIYSWMKDDGMDMSDIAIEVAPVDVGQSGELGLVAKTRLMPGDILAWAPKSLLFNKEKAVAVWGDAIEELPDRTAIVLFLLHERFVKGTSSKWKPYWAACPNFETDCCGPSFLWDEEEQSWLAGSDAREASIQMRDFLEEEFQELQEELFSKRPAEFPASAFTLGNYLWASAMVASRAYGDDAEGNHLAIAPLVDFINHQPGALQLTRFGNGIVAYAHRGYDPGEQVWVNYGSKSNAELLSQYGFVDDNNRYDAVYIRIGMHVLLPDSAQTHTKELISEALDGADPEQGILKVSCNAREWQVRLLPVMRALAADEEMEMKDLSLSDLMAPQHPEAEVQAWSLLDEAFRRRLAEYPASLEKDREQVQHGKHSERVKLALRLRVAEQELLQDARVHVSEQLERSRAEAAQAVEA